MAAIVNARDVLLQAAATRFVTPALVGTVDFANVTGGTKPQNNATVGATWGINLSAQPTSLGGINATEGSKLSGIADGADVTLSAVNGGLVVTGGGITLSGGGAIKGGKTDYGVGTGWFLGYSGGAYKFDIGSATSYMRWTGVALEIVGNLTGVSDIEISGGAKIGGNKMSVNFGGAAAAVVTNDSFGSPRGQISVADSTAQALVGYQINAAGTGVHAEAAGGGFALRSYGKFFIDNSTLVPSLNAEYLGGSSLAGIQAYVAANYSVLGHGHALSDLTTASRTAEYSTDGGGVWTPILLRFS